MLSWFKSGKFASRHFSTYINQYKQNVLTLWSQIKIITTYNDSQNLMGTIVIRTHHVLVVEVCDKTVAMVILGLIEWIELGKIIPITILLVTHMISNSMNIKEAKQLFTNL